jgi:phosphodiesterase/alkaline phosphatase D-like protein
MGERRALILAALFSAAFLAAGPAFAASAVRINEVAADQTPSGASQGDWLELYIDTNVTISSWTLSFTNSGTSERTVTLPALASGTFAGAQFVVVHFGTAAFANLPSAIVESTTTGDTNASGYWDVWFGTDTTGNASAMVGTDNVLILKDDLGNVIDGVVMADNSGSFTTTGGRGTRYNVIITSGQWNGPSSSTSPAVNIENAAVIKTAGTNNRVLQRNAASADTDASGFSKNDWGLSNAPTSGIVNSALADPTPPGSITDLSVAGQTADSITLSWTAVGDDSYTGNASKYVVRYSSIAILVTATDYFNATDFTNTLASPAVGVSTGVTIGSLMPGTTYWFVAVGQDDGDITQGNPKLGALPSNLPVSGLTSPDNQAPAAVTDLAASLASASAASVSLSWTAPSDPPSSAAATSYSLRFATFSVASLAGDSTAWWNLATDVSGEPTPGSPSAGQAQTVSGLPSAATAYFHIRSRDSANLSDIDSGTEPFVFVPAHLVISQMRSSGTATGRFVELYNPTSAAIDLTSPQIYLHRRSATGSTTANQALTGSVSAKGFYMVAISTNATGGLALDFAWPNDGTFFSTDNSVYISLSATELVSVVDVLAFGSGTDSNFVDFGDANAPARLADPTAGLAATRAPGSALGHSTDTNKWQSDFANDQTPNPRNSSSGPEPDAGAPGAVSDLAAAAGAADGDVTLTWTSPGDDGNTGNIVGGQFVVKYSSVQIINSADFDSPSFAVSSVTLSTGATAGSAQTYSLAGLLPGTTYWFALKTRDESVFSVWNSSVNNAAVNNSASVAAQDLAPSSPTAVTVTSRGSNFVSLSWSAPSPDPGDLGGYVLHYGTSTGVYTGTSTVGGLDSPVGVGNVLSYTLTGLNPNTSWYLALKSSDTAPNVQVSAFSTEVSTYTELAAPGAPATFTGTVQSVSAVRWDWALVAGATAYQLQTSTGGVVASLADPTSFYIESGLTSDTSSQIIRVQTFNLAGAGGTTNAGAAVYTLAAAPSGGSYVSVSSYSVSLTWGEGGNPPATDYEVSASTDSFSTNFSTPVTFAHGLTANSTTAFNLSPVTTYTFRVRARNRDGVATAFDTLSSTATSSPPLSGVIIHEIMYDPAGTDSGREWVEIFNASNTAVDLTGWTLFENGTNHGLTFTQGGNTLAAGAYAIIADNAATFLTDYSTHAASASWIVMDSAFSLTTGETLALKDASSIVQSTLTYANSTPWPAASGQSIERVSPAGLDNDGANWSTGPVVGTPAAANAASPDSTPPAAVSDLTATGGSTDGTINLTWTSPGDDGTTGVINEGQFVVVYSSAGIINDIDSPPSPSATLTLSTTAVPGTTHSRSFSGLTPGTSYWFAVKTRDEKGSNFATWTSSQTNAAVNNSAFAPVQDLAPDVPTSVQVVTRGPQFVQLSWAAPSTDPGDIASYKLHYGTTTAVYTGTSTVGGLNSPVDVGNVLAYTLTGLAINTSYYLALKTVDTGPNVMESAFSSEVSTFTEFAVPGAPASFAGTVQSVSSVRWDWSLVAGADTYELQTSTGGVTATLSDPTSFYIETGLTSDTSSQVIRVQAFNQAGAGGTKTGTAVYSLAAAPSGGNYVSVSSYSANISWNENGNPAATDYEVSASTDGFTANFSTPVAFAAGLTANTTTVLNLSPETNYTFRVRARNRDGVNTAFDTLASTTTGLPPAEGIVINEILYRLAGSDDPHEWIEVYNRSSQAVDMTGWRLVEAGTNHTFTVVQGTSVIPAGGFAIFADSGTVFLSDYASDANVASWNVFDSAFGLTDAGETLALKNASLITQSSLTYSGASPWPVVADGVSIERLNANGADNDGANWAAGPSNGTPGSANSSIPDTTPPAAVSNLTAVAGSADGEVLLSWTSPGDDGASNVISGGQFVIVYTTVSVINSIDSPPTPSATLTLSTGAAAGSAQSRTVTGLTPGTSYWFAIKVRDEVSTNFSTWTSSQTNPAVNTLAYAPAQDLPPGVPSFGTVTSFNKSLSVPFSAPSPDPGDIVTYNVYRATYAFTTATDPSVATNSFTNTQSAYDTGINVLTNGVTYYIRIEAVDGLPGQLSSGLSAAVTGIPRIRAPATLSATHNGSTVDVSWSAAGDVAAANFGGYNLYRSTASGGPYAFVVLVSSSATTHRDASGIDPALTYYYVVRSSDSDSASLLTESVDSPEATAVSDTVAPEITHTPVVFLVLEEAALTLTASAKDFRDAAKALSGNVQSLTLHVRVLGSTGAYTSIAFTGSGFGTGEAQGTAEVPLSFLQTAASSGGFNYYIAVFDGVNTSDTRTAALPDGYGTVVEAPSSLVVGPGGGTVKTPGGFVEVVITTNALAGHLTITATPLKVTAVTPADGTPSVPIGSGYGGRPLIAAEFGPDGLRFRVPVRVRLKFLDADGDGFPELPPGGEANELPNTPDFQTARLKIYVLSAGRWKLIGGKREGDRITVNTSHFSTYALFPTAAIVAAAPLERFVTPNGDGANDTATFGIDVTRVTVYDSTGLEVWSGTGDGVTAMQWGATDTDGALVENGLYIYKADEASGGTTHGAIVVAK